MENIKFRAWHKEEKIMCKVTLLDPERGAFLIGVKPDKDQYIKGGKEIVISPKDGRFCKLSEFELIQFIGITDMDGIDIYDSYILKDHGIVAWNDVEHCWSAIDLNWNDKREWHNIDYLTCPFKVIGNIHENPELLK